MSAQTNHPDTLEHPDEPQVLHAAFKVRGKIFERWDEALAYRYLRELDDAIYSFRELPDLLGSWENDLSSYITQTIARADRAHAEALGHALYCYIEACEMIDKQDAETLAALKTTMCPAPDIGEIEDIPQPAPVLSPELLKGATYVQPWDRHSKVEQAVTKPAPQDDESGPFW